MGMQVMLGSGEYRFHQRTWASLFVEVLYCFSFNNDIDYDCTTVVVLVTLFVIKVI